MAQNDSEGLQIAYGQDGLYSAPQRDVPLYLASQDDDKPGDQQTSITAFEEPKTKRKCGMKPLHFYITTVVILFLVLAAAIGGGVGGTLADRSGGNSGDTSPSTKASSTSAPTSSTTAAAVNTTIPAADNKLFSASERGLITLHYVSDDSVAATRFTLETDNNFVVYDNSTSGGGWATMWSSKENGGYVVGNGTACGKDDTKCWLVFAQDGRLVNYVSGTLIGYSNSTAKWVTKDAERLGGTTFILSNKSPWISLQANNGSIVWTLSQGIDPID